MFVFKSLIVSGKFDGLQSSQVYTFCNVFLISFCKLNSNLEFQNGIYLQK